jgi:hypothetical protein
MRIFNKKSEHALLKDSNTILRDKCCVICYEKIKGNCISCLDCRTLSHHNCYFKWTNTANFTICPFCKQSNLITSYLQQEIDIDKKRLNNNFNL